MGQIIGRSAKPDACNLRSLSSYGTPAAGQHILVSTDNSAMQNGQGNFDAYVVGDGTTAATALELKKICDVTEEDIQTTDFISTFYDGTLLGETITPSISSSTTRQTYYKKVNTGDVIGIIVTYSENYLRVGFTTEKPARGVAVSNLASYAVASSGKEIYFRAPSDGYMCFSLPVSGSDVVSIKKTNSNFGGVVSEELRRKISLNIINESGATGYDNMYINYSTGARVLPSASHQFKCWVFPCAGVKYIKAILGSLDEVPASLAFYSSPVNMTVNAVGTYMQEVSIRSNIGTMEYFAEVPDGAQNVVISNRGASNASPEIYLYKDPYYQEQGTTPDYVEYDVEDGLECDYLENYYVRFSDGRKISAGTSHQFKSYYFNCENVVKIRATLGSVDNVPAAVAFFSSDINVNVNVMGDYMLEDSIQAIAGTQDYEVNVPSGAKYAFVTNRYATLSEPIIKLLCNPFAKETADSKRNNAAFEGYAINPFAGAPYCYHFAANSFLYDGNNQKAIASESLEDVATAARLGFKFIEANIHKTSDDNFVCIHGGSGGNFSVECISADESVITTSDLQATLISSVTLSWIKSYVRYGTTTPRYAKNRTTIPTLEEFCICCKANNIGLFAGTSDEDAIAKCIEYMGNNLILYNPPTSIRNKFNGYVLRWYNAATITPETLLADAKMYGAPFISSIGPTTINQLKSDNKLTQFVQQMHENGFLIGFASVYQSEQETRELIEIGFDFSGSGHEVNPFTSNYELFDIDGDVLPTTTGTLANGVIELASAQTITCGSSSKIYLGCGELVIRFAGSLRITFGSVGERVVTSDGSDYVVISDYFLNNSTELSVTAEEQTTITHFVYKTSRC